MPSDATIPTWRGTVLVCDEVYQTTTGKWVIAGTYSRWMTIEPMLLFPQGVGLYLRFLPEAMGKAEGSLLIIDADQPSTVPPVIRINLTIDVKQPLVPIELGIRTPPWAIKRPMAADGSLAMHAERHFKVWLKMSGIDLASSPFDVIFTSGDRHVADHAPNSGDCPPAGHL